MPLIKSAKKRVRVAHKAAVRNSKTKRSLKSALKAFSNSLGGDSKKTSTAQSKAQSNIDKAVKKGLVHKNKAARQKRKLAAAAKSAGISPAKKPTTKKPTTKKSPAKKSPAKK